MAKAVFYIRDKVQEVGYRAFVMERLLETNLKGGAVNTEDGNVMVLIEGEESRIIEFVERLKRENPELSENPVLTGPEFDEMLEIPDEIRIAHSLEMNQFGKAVVYLDGIGKKLGEMQKTDKEVAGKFDELGKKIDNLPEKIAGRLEKKFDELPGKISEALGKRFDELGESFDKLPERIAKAISAEQRAEPNKKL